MKTHAAPEPSPWLRRFLPVAATGATLLDVACGGGRHLRLALERGYRVTGIDRDLSALEDLSARADVELVAADLETGAPFPSAGRRFAAVVVTNYLWRPILSDIVAGVSDSGALIYETFALGNERHGRPSNPDFLLRPGELIEAVRGRLFIAAFEDGVLQRNSSPCRVQRIAACGPDHPWAHDAPIELNDERA